MHIAGLDAAMQLETWLYVLGVILLQHSKSEASLTVVLMLQGLSPP